MAANICFVHRACDETNRVPSLYLVAGTTGDDRKEIVIGAILLLGLVVFGLQVLFGRQDAGRLYPFLILLTIGPILLSIGLSHSIWFWQGLPLWSQVITVLIIPFLVIAVIRRFLPRSAALDRVQGVAFDTLVYLVTFPIRLLWRSGQFILRRERRPVRLNPRRPVVGGRPPLVNYRERRER